MRKKDTTFWIAIGTSLLGGASAPLVFLLLRATCGEACQSTYIEYKTQIDLGTALFLLGLDKAYIFHNENKNSPKFFHLLLPLLLSSALFFALLPFDFPSFRIEDRGKTYVSIVLVGIIGGCIFGISRAVALTQHGYLNFNRITLALYAIPVIYTPIALISVSLMICATTVTWALIAWKLTLSSHLNNKIRTDKNADWGKLGRDIKYGSSEILISLGILAPSYLTVNHFNLSNNTSTSPIIFLGFLFILSSLIRFPISTLIPIIIKETFKVTNRQIGIFIGVCILSGIACGLIFNVYFLKKIEWNPAVSLYIFLSSTAYILQIHLYKNGKSKIILFSTIASIAMLFLFPTFSPKSLDFSHVIFILCFSEFLKILICAGTPLASKIKHR